MPGTTPPDLLPPAVQDGPATAKLVYLALEGHGPATAETLALATGQSRRAVINVFGDLEDAGLVTARPDPQAPSRNLWVVRD